MKDRQGLTLVDLIMASAIGIFVLGAIASMLFAGLGAIKSAGQFHAVYQQARRAMQWINRDVKESYSVLNVQTIDAKVYQTDKDTLVLQRSGGGLSGDYDFVVYDLVQDTADYMGGNTYRLERTFFDNYTIAGVAKIGSSSNTRVVATNVTPPTGSGYLFNAAGTKVSVDLTVATIARRAREQMVSLDTKSFGNPSTSNESQKATLRLVSEIKMRN